MPKPTSPANTYVRKVNEDTLQYIQDLLQKNQSLRSISASQREEIQKILESLTKVQEIQEENKSLRANLDHLAEERTRLREQLQTLRDELHRFQSEHQTLESQFSEIEEENRSLSERYIEIEEQTSNLANLYVSSYQLHGTLDRSEVLTAIQEIIINLVGSEELAVFEMAEDQEHLDLILSTGIEESIFNTVPLGSGIIGDCARDGRAFIAGNGEARPTLPSEKTLTACVPLKVAGKVTGAIAIFRILPQKGTLMPNDRELLNLLATHAATSLYLTSLHQKVG